MHLDLCTVVYVTYISMKKRTAGKEKILHEERW